MRIVEIEFIHRAHEILEVDRVFKAASFGYCVNAHLLEKVVNKHHVPAQLFETKDVLEKDPCVTSTPGLLCQGTGDDHCFLHETRCVLFASRCRKRATTP